jgi:hypothetical protein
MKKLFAFCLFLPIAALGNQPSLDDFAAGFEIRAEANAAIYRLSLPAAVYLTSTREDLGDVRVFNDDGQPIPDAIRRQQEITSTETIHTDVPFFPLPNDIATATGKLDITVRADGAIVSINKSGNGPAETDASTIRYILDLSGIKSSVDALEFTIISRDRNYLKRAMLEASDDLNNWSPLVQNAALSSLQYAGHDLVKNRINLAGPKPKYLRFTWQDEITQIRITGIRATLDNRISNHRRTWSTVDGVGAKEKGRQIYNFDTGGVFPVEQVEVLLPEENSLIDATLESRKNKKDTWRVRDTGLFYHLRMKNTHLERGPVTIGRTTDRYWRLEVKNEDGMGTTPPRLKFAWQPDELYFLARGKGPFVLAYGNADAPAPGKPVDALMHALSDDQQSEMVAAAAPGRPLELKGEAALKPGMKIHWQRILLWSVLVIGVLVLAIITLRLFKQMGQTGTPT